MGDTEIAAVDFDSLLVQRQALEAFRVKAQVDVALDHGDDGGSSAAGSHLGFHLARQLQIGWPRQSMREDR